MTKTIAKIRCLRGHERPTVPTTTHRFYHYRASHTPEGRRKLDHQVI